MSRTMNNNGIPWIGEIPSHWRTERIKTIFSERTELSEDGTEDLLSVSEYYGVDKRAGRVEEGEYVSRSESLVGYKKCYRGDFVSNIMLAWKGSLGVSDYDVLHTAFINPKTLFSQSTTIIFLEHLSIQDVFAVFQRA